MKTFFGENIGIALKLMLSQFAAAIFGILVTTATVEYSGLALVFSVVAVLFYMFLIYVQVWELGAKDIIKIRGGRMKNMPLRGLYIGLLANLFNILCGIAIVAAYAYRGYDITGTIYTIALAIASLYQSFFKGIGEFTVKNYSFFYLLTPILPIAVSAAAYILGTKGILNPTKKKENR